MPKLDLTQDELNQLAQCIETEISSAKRAQHSGKTPQIQAVYRAHEATLTQLQHKIVSAK